MRKTYEREMYILSIFMVCLYLVLCANKYFSKEVSVIVDKPKIVNNYNSDEFTITASVIKENDDGTITKTVIEGNRPGEDIYIPFVDDSAYEKGISFIEFMWKESSYYKIYQKLKR